MSQGTTENEYESSLIDFHRALGSAGVLGYIGSAVFKVEGIPWIGEAPQAYEDWYLMEGSAVLDALNTAAVSGKRKSFHDMAARFAVDFKAGLYYSQVGRGIGLEGINATWLSKPRAMPYEKFYKWAQSLVETGGGTLWRRQMVLGPSPEFCLTGSPTQKLPSKYLPIEVRRNIVWLSPALS